MTIDDFEFVQYFLVRTDLESLNPGKAMAQVAHAANLMVYNILTSQTMRKKFKYDLDIWSSGRGFGTSIVLDGRSISEIQDALDSIESNNVHYQWLIDPTYPLRDGDVVHHIPLETCAFIFGRKKDVAPHLTNFELYF